MDSSDLCAPHKSLGSLLAATATAFALRGPGPLAATGSRSFVSALSLDTSGSAFRPCGARGRRNR